MISPHFLWKEVLRKMRLLFIDSLLHPFPNNPPFTHFNAPHDTHSPPFLVEKPPTVYFVLPAVQQCVHKEEEEDESPACSLAIKIGSGGGGGGGRKGGCKWLLRRWWWSKHVQRRRRSEKEIGVVVRYGTSPKVWEARR